MVLDNVPYYTLRNMQLECARKHRKTKSEALERFPKKHTSIVLSKYHHSVKDLLIQASEAKHRSKIILLNVLSKTKLYNVSF